MPLLGELSAEASVADMLCESKLWSLVFCPDQENLDHQDPVTSDSQDQIIRTGSQSSAAPLLSTPPSPDQPRRREYSTLPRVPHTQRSSEGPFQALQPQPKPQPGGAISPQMEIPGQALSPINAPFLVPSSCQSICKNYSDLHIGGDQVLPIFVHDCELLPCSESQSNRPLLDSCDTPPADFYPNMGSPDQPLGALKGGLSCWRAGSGWDRSFLLQGREGPLSNSLLNRYLEHKLLDLYQQYMLENMAREGACGSGSYTSSPCPLLGSELVLTSLDNLTMQLSRVGNVEAGRAKDMVMSCLLRVASDLGESHISTPLLQISNEGSSTNLPGPSKQTKGSEDQSQTEAETQSVVESLHEGDLHSDSSDPTVKDIL